MRYTHMGAGIGLALGALGLQIPVAVAADDSHVRIDPGDGSPGSTVTVSTSDCDPAADYGKGWSEVGGEFHLFAGDEEGVLTGRFTIPEGTGAGTDTITLKCPPRTKVTETYQVTGRTPRGSVSAGFGPGEDSGVALALGGGLLLTATAGGLVWICRRPNDNRS
ncbi:sortase [Streptomyces sp. TRM S81-3]|uniref:Sortase n=1 Tax=Streptomyces griseicoloratus TaxID=2752516 RepID=A0A926LDW9_9ACTN|nr:sortase [Streptomyces griseicoloratus]MBD0424698.1 sortase [Streptomyces griseicoloratus]